MKSRFLALVVCSAAAASPLWADSPVGVIVLSPPPGSAAALPLRFDHAPLGNVIRVLSARFGAPVTLVGAKATTPITGDFAGLGLRPALAAAAAQAGLVVSPVGPDDRAGYALGPPPPAGETSAATPIEGTAAQAQAALAAAARERERLLRLRAQLQDAAARLEP